MEIGTDKLKIVGKHDERTIAQMRKCLRDDRAIAGVLCADGHLGYAQPVGGVIAYHDSISVSGVGFDIACGNYAVRTDLAAADLDAGYMRALADQIAENISFGVGRRTLTRMSSIRSSRRTRTPDGTSRSSES
jgi:tRNA-splicing ligase RtcB (3'-phosphate/5'-hydroxy nucleic acid ligase)